MLERTARISLMLAVAIATFGGTSASAQDAAARTRSAAALAPPGLANADAAEYAALRQRGISPRRVRLEHRLELHAIASDAALGSALLPTGVMFIVLGAVSALVVGIVALTSAVGRIGRGVDCLLSRCSSTETDNGIGFGAIAALGGALAAAGIALTVAGAVASRQASRRRDALVRSLSLSFSPVPGGAVGSVAVTF